MGTHPSRRLSALMQDGIGNANESVLAASTVHGFFSPVVLQSTVLGAPTTLHLFEYTARCVQPGSQRGRQGGGKEQGCCHAWWRQPSKAQWQRLTHTARTQSLRAASGSQVATHGSRPRSPRAALLCDSPPCTHPCRSRLPAPRFKKYAGLDNYPPLQIMFATKGKNKGKLDSHCWYFDAFCYLLQPEFCVLFDAGGC